MWDDIDRIDIVYICSNAQIATQNMRKLQLGGERFVHADRLTLLPQAIHDIRQNKVNYLAFSPGTSFDLRSSLGRKDERVLLYHLVQRLWPDPAAAPKNLFQGWVIEPWRAPSRSGSMTSDAHPDGEAKAFERSTWTCATASAGPANTFRPAIGRTRRP